MTLVPTTGSGKLRRIILRLIAAVVLVNVLVFVLGEVIEGGVDGPTGSSYVTHAGGLAAYAELLDEYGHVVSRLREPAGSDLDPSVTLVVVEPFPDRLVEAELRAIAGFVAAGGRLVAGGTFATEWLQELLASPPQWSPVGAGTVEPVVPAPEVRGVGSVQTGIIGSWDNTGEAVPLLADPSGRAVAAVATVGRGRLVLLADVSVLSNGLLDRADNAAFALAAAGGDRREVVFHEYVHGYVDGGGLSTIPAGWRWALGLVGVAAVVWLVAKGRRLGPPEQTTRPLPPPRVQYVDALAATLARTRKPEAATAPLRAAARRMLAARAGLPAGAPIPRLVAAGRELGLSDEELRALTIPGGGEEQLLAAGRALARLHGPRAIVRADRPDEGSAR